MMNMDVVFLSLIKIIHFSGFVLLFKVVFWLWWWWGKINFDEVRLKQADELLDLNSIICFYTKTVSRLRAYTHTCVYTVCNAIFEFSTLLFRTKNSMGDRTTDITNSRFIYPFQKAINFIIKVNIPSWKSITEFQTHITQ